MTRQTPARRRRGHRYSQVLSLLIPIASAAANPYQQGCLFSKNLTSKIRVCSSEDSPDALTQGLCRPPPFDYKEVRLAPGDWESCLFGTWILQIALSEWLQVPVSIEMGDPQSSFNFYHPESPFEAPTDHVNYLTSLENAHAFDGDCSKADRGEANYQQCAHFVPEEWNAREPAIQELIYNENLEPLQDLGMLASEGWYIPKYTANTDPSLLTYGNMQGQSNREKLAELFKRPTTWKEYCQLISTNNCSTPDDHATRPPQSPEENDQLFSAGSYTGYFRPTNKNDCQTNPQTCTGHFVDWPCSWSSPVTGQLYHLDIALDTDIDDHEAYTYSQLLQIWRAANATRSHVMMMWWKPELFARDFQGTDFEFVPVQLPEATQACLDARGTNNNQCSSNKTERVGLPEGACGDPPKGLHTLVSSTLHPQTYGRPTHPIPSAIQSPSYAALGNYRLSELQLGEIFTLWREEHDNPRDALCTWVSSNMEYMQRLIPRGYPRVPQPAQHNPPIMYAATLVASLVTFLVLVTMILVYTNRHKLSIVYAQIEFLALLLVGALLVALGALVAGAPSTNASCIVEIWAINIGYTLELVPLIVKVAAVNHVMNVGRMMKRVRIRRDLLVGLVLSISILVVIYLIFWTVLDPPRIIPEYQLSDEVTEEGETIVWVLDVCSSHSQTWAYISVGWNGLLLLFTSIQAIQMRKVEMQGFCETPTLALMVYSSLLFVLMRVVTYLLASSVSAYTLARCRSLIFSIDTTATIIIYFLPKIYFQEPERVSGNINISAHSLNPSMHTNYPAHYHRQSHAHQLQDNSFESNRRGVMHLLKQGVSSFTRRSNNIRSTQATTNSTMENIHPGEESDQGSPAETTARDESGTADVEQARHKNSSLRKSSNKKFRRSANMTKQPSFLRSSAMSKQPSFRPRMTKQPSRRSRDKRMSWLVIIKDSDELNDPSDLDLDHDDDDNDDRSFADDTTSNRAGDREFPFLLQHIEQLEEEKVALIAETEKEKKAVLVFEQQVEKVEEEKKALLLEKEQQVEKLEWEKIALLKANNRKQQEISKLRAELLGTTPTSKSRGDVQQDHKAVNGDSSNEPLGVLSRSA